MFAAITSRAALTGNRLLLRSFATVGSQIPAVELHSELFMELDAMMSCQIVNSERASILSWRRQIDFVLPYLALYSFSFKMILRTQCLIINEPIFSIINSLFIPNSRISSDREFPTGKDVSDNK